MYGRHWLFIGLVLLLQACVSVAELPKPVSVFGLIPGDTRSVAVRVVPSKPGSLKNAGGLTDPGLSLARYVVEALALKQAGWEVKVLDGRRQAESDLLATIDVLSVDGGSAGLRFWIGFSAGATESTTAVSVSDKSGRELAQATITERTMCPIGACVESNEDTIQRNLKSLAEEIADFVSDPAAYKKEK